MKATYSVFPKFLRHLDTHQLAELVHQVGLDTVNVVIRDGYRVDETSIGNELANYITDLKNEGLAPYFATTGYTADYLAADPTPLAIMADNGITQFRLGYFWMKQGDARQSLTEARAGIAALSELCERNNIKAVYQVHHGTLISSAFAAYGLVKDTNPAYIGVELDPGNQAHEGYEAWDKSVSLLADYVVAVGIKDVAWVKQRKLEDRPTTEWRNQLVGLKEGVTDWYELLRALNRQNFAGTFAFMPFYHEDDPAKLVEQLKLDVDYLRIAQREVESE